MSRLIARSRRNIRPVEIRRDRDQGNVHPIGTPNGGVSPNTGPLASAAWLMARGGYPTESRWFVEIVLDADAAAGRELDQACATRFMIEVYAEEWGFMFCHRGQVSWIRVTDIPFVHGRDDHQLLRQTPPLRDIGRLIHNLEKQHAIALPRATAIIRTCLTDAESAIREWTAKL
ncbi:MAG: hypothetical protein H0T89_25240 [Deltaproteobacteria bacterium]|nr:hypothetical protein [Deltaproteobacteria bacterium]MDQ3297657.1 hypothetical protein [Myxococcota bacterium]